MDLSAMLNDGPAPEKKKSHGSPPPPLAPIGRGSAPQPSPAGPNGAPSAGPGAYSQPRHEQPPTPLYAPHSGSVGPHSQSQSRGLTPLHTPGSAHLPGGAQYPFPHQQHPPLQSPATAGPGAGQHQPYRTYEPQSAMTPGARPPSHGYPFAQPSPSQHGPGMYGQQHPSQSPTPSSHHSQTPHSMRHSPLTAMGHPPPHQQQPPPHAYQHSQPNTPLGPPTLIPRHSGNQYDAASPFHSRTFSGASNGMPLGSPAQHQSSIGHLLDSPSAQHRPSPQRRSASDYQSLTERERSVSVSPKTKIPPRPPSLGSRNSSQQEVYSARSSLQPNSASVAPHSEVPNHVHAATTPSYAQPHYPHPASEVPQASSHMPEPRPELSLSSNNKVPLPLNNENRPEPMQHLQAPLQPLQALSPTSHRQNTAPPPQGTSPVANPMKRSAESELSEAAPPLKREKRRKYAAQRPIWANLHPQNPRFSTSSVPNGTMKAQPQQQPQAQNQPPSQQHQQPRPPPSQQPNGQHPAPRAQTAQTNGAEMAVPPFPRWEKSILNTAPISPIAKAVGDWLYSMLHQNADVGWDPREGTIEVEGKIGTLMDEQNNRLRLPVSNMVVVNTDYADRQCRFESAMSDIEHQTMNKFLNKVAETSHRDPSREKIVYKHLKETDRFQTLSKTGQGLLPACAHNRPRGREIKLRTTTDNDTHQIKAQIVKIPLGNLHIFNPQEPYDMRISMNLEVNLDRPEIDPTALYDDDKPTQPERKKDRLSYKHLAYQIDLTRVDTPGMAPKYELEIELDSKPLREHMAKLQEGGAGYMNLVEGFLDNAMLLMKQPRG